MEVEGLLLQQVDCTHGQDDTFISSTKIYAPQDESSFLWLCTS